MHLAEPKNQAIPIAAGDSRHLFAVRDQTDQCWQRQRQSPLPPNLTHSPDATHRQRHGSILIVFAFLRKRALASPNRLSTHSRRAEWSTFDSVLALFADSLSNRIFCLKMSVSCSIGAGRSAFLSPSAPAPCTAMRVERRPYRDCFEVSWLVVVHEQASQGYPVRLGVASATSQRSPSISGVFFSRSVSFVEALLCSDSF